MFRADFRQKYFILSLLGTLHWLSVFLSLTLFMNSEHFPKRFWEKQMVSWHFVRLSVFMYSFSQAIITKHHRLSDFKQQTFIFRVLVARKSATSRDWWNSISEEALLPGLKMAMLLWLLLFPHVMKKKREEISLISSYKATKSI